MGRTSSSSDAFGRGAAPAAGPFSLSKDMFKEQAERLAARKGGKPVGDAFASRPGAKRNSFTASIETPPPVREAAFRSEPPRRTWTLANGAALQVVASQQQIADAELETRDEKRIERRAAKSSSFVLVSSSSVVEAPAPAAGGGGQGELVMPSLSSSKFQPKAKPKKSGGGGSGGGGAGDGGGAVAPRDRIFNQDDLAGVLIVLAVLLLMMLYLLRGNGGAAGGEEETLNVQSASSEPAAPAGPPPDPFGNQAVDLTPKSPPPPEPAVVEAAPAPAAPETAVAPAAAVAPAGLEVRVHAYFCTDKSELTPASATALDKEIAAWGDRITGKDLVVAGYADTRGVAVYNTWLGGERAKAVVNYLTAKGFRATAVAVGELPDLTDNENCANQRRVDVRLADAPEETPSRSCAPPPELAALACVVEQRKSPASSEPEPTAPAQ